MFDIQTGVGLNSLTVAKSKDKLLGILQLFCRKSCHSGLFICNALSGGFKGFNGALLLCAPIWQWQLSGSLRCKHSCTYRMTLLIYKKVVSVLNRVDDTVFLHLKLNWKFLQNWAISDKLSQTTSTVYIHSKPANKYLVYSKFQLQNFFEMQWFCLCYHSRTSKYICFIRMQPEGSNTCVANFNNNLD